LRRRALPAFDGEADAGGFVEGFFVLFVGIRIGDDAGTDLID
jgi:hypothetical protein